MTHYPNPAPSTAPNGAPPPWAGGYPTSGYAPKTALLPSNSKAVWSMILGWLGSFVGFFTFGAPNIVGIILGHKARAEIRANPYQDGRTLTVFALIANYMSAVFGVVYSLVLLFALIAASASSGY